MSASLANWIPEILASFIISLFVAAVTYQWLVGGGLSDVMMLVFVLTVLSAVATIFGVDRLKQVASIWFE